MSSALRCRSFTTTDPAPVPPATAAALLQAMSPAARLAREQTLREHLGSDCLPRPCPRVPTPADPTPPAPPPDLAAVLLPKACRVRRVAAGR